MYSSKCISSGVNVATDWCIFFSHGVVRLTRGNAASASNNAGPVYGIVQVFVRRVWAQVCADGFHQNDAKVFCRQMKYRYGQILSPGRFGGSGTYSGGTMISPLGCNGTETSVFNCSYNFDSCSNSYTNYATVLCSKSPLASGK